MVRDVYRNVVRGDMRPPDAIASACASCSVHGVVELLRLAFVFFVTGAVLGTLGDRIHTYSGVLDYPHPIAFGEAWWVPLLMGAAGVLFGFGGRIQRRFFRDARPVAPSRALVSLAIFAASYLATGLFRAHSIALAVAISGAFVLHALARRLGPTYWLGALGAAVGGTLFESALSGTGAFRYLAPDMVNVPVWLPALYLHVAVFADDAERALTLRG